MLHYDQLAVALGCCVLLNADPRRSNRVGFATGCKLSNPPPGSPDQDVQVYLRFEAVCMHANRLCSTACSTRYDFCCLHLCVRHAGRTSEGDN